MNKSKSFGAQDVAGEVSTPSLEDIQQWYRTLEKQQTSRVKFIIGNLVLVSVYVALIAVHVVLLPQMEELQFNNWLTCAIFTFILQVFAIDMLLYLVVAWALKKSSGRG